MDDKQKLLIDAARLGEILDMYKLIANGADPFVFDQDGKSALQYAVESDPIKAHTLLGDLSLIYTSSTQQEIIKHYTQLAIKLGGNNNSHV